MGMVPSEYTECKAVIEQLERENAELNKLVERIRKALERVASQMLTEEMNKEERERAEDCYEDAYQIMVKDARAALEAAKGGKT